MGSDALVSRSVWFRELRVFIPKFGICEPSGLEGLGLFSLSELREEDGL